MYDQPSVPQRFGKIPEVNNRDPPKENTKHSYSSQTEKKSRLHSMITYATIDDIKKVFEYHKEQVKRWCAISHDKDKDENGEPVTPHHHIVVEFYDAYRVTSIRNWFKACFDEKGEAVTTLGQIVKDRRSVIDYLTHENEPDKYHYPVEEVINYPDMVMISGTSPRNDDEPSLNIIDDMLHGASYYELIRRYGREFIIHNHRYREMIALMISDMSLPDDLTRDQKNEIYYKYRN